MKSDISFHIQDVSIYINTLNDNSLSNISFFLTNQEKEKIATFKNQSRIDSFVETRWLVHSIFPGNTIRYNTLGAPHLYPLNGFLSISHSGAFCGIAFSKEKKIGLDMECYSEKAHRVRSKFLHPDEEQFAISAKMDTIIWSAKEALYKISEKNQLIFKTQLRIMKHNPETSTFDAVIHFHNERTVSYTIHYILHEHFILTLALEKK